MTYPAFCAVLVRWLVVHQRIGGVVNVERVAPPHQGGGELVVKKLAAWRMAS